MGGATEAAEELHSFEVTYEFGGYHEGTHDAAITRFENKLERMREEGWSVDVVDSVAIEDETGDVVEIVVRFAASDEGLVGWHAYRARLPISEIVRVDTDDRSHEPREPLETRSSATVPL